MHLFVLCLVAGFAPATGSVEKVTPVQKVIQLLEDMIATGVKEKQAEEIQFAEYAGSPPTCRSPYGVPGESGNKAGG